MSCSPLIFPTTIFWTAMYMGLLLLWRYSFDFLFLKKVKFSRYRPGMAQRLRRGIALLFHDRGTRRGEWSAARPGRTLPLGKTRYPFYRRLVGPQGWSGRAENLAPTGIRSQTVQPVAQSLYRLSYPAHMYHSTCIYIWTLKNGSRFGKMLS